MKNLRSLYLSLPTVLLLSQGCSKAPSAPMVAGTKKAATYSKPNDKSSDSTKKDEADDEAPVKTPSDPVDPSEPIEPSDPAPDIKDPVPDGSNDGMMPDPVIPKPVDPNAPIAACASLDYAKMTKIEDMFCLGSREKVIQSLPEILRSYFTLMQTSRSAQEASLENPRVIIASPDGSLLLGAATDANGRQDLEVAFYDYQKNTYDFAGIDFSTNPPKVERELCKSCHGLEPRPIWAAYSRWSGAFEPTNQGLTAPQATVLNKLAKGETESPILKALKYKSSYAANKLFNAASGLAETETNEMIGIMMAVKRSQMLTAKLMANPDVAKSSLGKVIHESLCENSTNTLASLGYTVAEHLTTGIAGSADERNNAFRNPNIGFQSLNFFFGNILLKAAMDKDPALKTQLSAVQKLYYANNSFEILTGNGLASYLEKTKARRTSWLSFRNLVNGDIKRTFVRGSEACNIIKSYQ